MYGIVMPPHMVPDRELAEVAGYDDTVDADNYVIDADFRKDLDELERAAYIGHGSKARVGPTVHITQRGIDALLRDPSRNVEATRHSHRSQKHAESYVALLDILGFSTLVATGEFEEKRGDYFRILHRAIYRPFDEPLLLQYVTFSDTIVISTDGTPTGFLQALVLAVGRVCGEALVTLGWPVRGAISVGKLTRTEIDGNLVVAGPPIVDAYDHERKQKWIGVMLSPKLLAHLSTEDGALDR